MSMTTHWSIDWLSMTFKGGLKDKDVRKAMSLGYPSRAWTEVPPKFGYSYCLQHPLGHLVFANHNRPEMGVHLVIGGRALKALEDGGLSATEMLYWSMKEGARITRIDLAIDVMGQHIDIPGLVSCPRVKDAPGTARKWSSIVGSDGGITAYIGSRKSDKFLRVYDKAAEQGMTGALWTRFEIELKGDAARAAALQMAHLTDAEKPLFIQGLIKDLFNPDDPIYQEAMKGEAVRLTTSKDVNDNTIEWILNQVAKSMARAMIRRSDLNLWELFTEAVQANIDQFTDAAQRGRGDENETNK